MAAPNRTPLVDPQTGMVTGAWLNYFVDTLEQSGSTALQSLTNVSITRNIVGGGGPSLDITVDASTLTGSTLAPSVVGSSLTGVGTLTSGRTGVGFVIDLTASTVLGMNNLLTNLTGDLIPAVTDTYDIGSSTRLWRQAYIGQINAVLFAKETQSLYGGWLAVSKNAGVFPSNISAAATTIDFGQLMTLNQFVLVRAADSGGTITSEFLKVGALVSGTTYTVTRNLSGLGAKSWMAGTAYQVRGVTGDGWIELNAFDTPRFSVFTQGTLYNNSAENIRIGHLTGMPNGSSGIGVYIGDASNYLRYDTTAMVLKSADLSIDATGIYLAPTNVLADPLRKQTFRFSRISTSLFEQGTTDVNGIGASEFRQSSGTPTTFSTLKINNGMVGKATAAGGEIGDATLVVQASGWSPSQLGGHLCQITMHSSHLTSQGANIVITAQGLLTTGATSFTLDSPVSGVYGTATLQADSFTVPDLSLTIPASANAQRGHFFRPTASNHQTAISHNMRYVSGSGFFRDDTAQSSWQMRMVGNGDGDVILFEQIASGAGANPQAPTEKGRITATGNYLAAGHVQVAAGKSLGFSTDTDTFIDNDAANRLRFSAGAINIFWDGTQFFPETDGGRNLGALTFRWGTVYAAVGVINTSDRRQKRAITPTGHATAFLLALQPVDYLWRRGGDGRRHSGFLAQDVAAVAPTFGGICLDADGEAVGLNYSEFLAPLVAGFQDHESRLRALEERTA